MGARAPTLITGQLAPQRRQLPQLIERSAFVRSRRNGSSTVDQDIAAEPKIVAGAAKLVENGPRATDVAFERSRSLVLTVGPRRQVFLQGGFLVINFLVVLSALLALFVLRVSVSGGVL